MIDHSVLKTRKNSRILTTTSVKEFIYRCSSNERMEAFAELANNPEYRMTWSTYYRCLCEAYECSDGIDIDMADELFSEFEDEFWLGLADKKSQKFYNDLPDVVTIYRGCTKAEAESGNYGISWTTDKNVAEFFAHEYIRRDTDNGVVMEAQISKSLICAVILGRDEKEVVIPYANANIRNANVA